MLDSQQKRKINQVLYHRATLVILLIVVLFVAHSTWVVYQKKTESEELRDISFKYKEGLETREKELELQTERLMTDAGKEAEIRSKFSVAKGDENIVVVVEEPVTEATSTTESIWQKIKKYFGI